MIQIKTQFLNWFAQCLFVARAVVNLNDFLLINNVVRSVSLRCRSCLELLWMLQIRWWSIAAQKERFPELVESSLEVATIKRLSF